MLPPPRETELEMVQRHVRLGEEHVTKQLGIVAKLTENGRPTALALQLLFEFERSLTEHRNHLERLLQEHIKGSPPGK